jgi:hypothetical protein
VSATILYRGFLAIRGCWILLEWLFSWGVYSHASLFRSLHPYAALIADALSVVSWLAMLTGMWFFQRWARFIFAFFFVIAVLIAPFRPHGYSLSAQPSFVAPLSMIMLLLTVAILAMAFLPPVRDCFTRKRPNQSLEPTAGRCTESLKDDL